MRQKLTERYAGYRAFTQRVLEALPLADHDDDFIFDNHVLTPAPYFGWRIGEIRCPARHFAEASNIDFRRIRKYGVGILRMSGLCFLERNGLFHSRLFPRNVPASQRGPGTAETVK